MNISKILSGVFVVFALGVLVSVRFFESVLFYDPLNEYFHNNFQTMPYPEMELGKLLLSNSLRFLINCVTSLWILWFLYKSRIYVKAGLWVFLFAFVLLTAMMLALLQVETDLAKMTLFYTRRFLIHPILLFILVAGCYYLNTQKKEL